VKLPAHTRRATATVAGRRVTARRTAKGLRVKLPAGRMLPVRLVVTVHRTTGRTSRIVRRLKTCRAA